jgi:hypothetical protein
VVIGSTKEQILRLIRQPIRRLCLRHRQDLVKEPPFAQEIAQREYSVGLLDHVSVYFQSGFDFRQQSALNLRLLRQLMASLGRRRWLDLGLGSGLFFARRSWSGSVVVVLTSARHGMRVGWGDCIATEAAVTGRGCDALSVNGGER